MISKQKIEHFVGWLAVIFLVATSGIPIVSELTSREFVWPIAAIVLGALWAWKGCPFSRNGIWMLLFFGLVLLVHAFVYWESGVKSTLGFTMMLICAFLAVNVTPNFIEKYINVMVVISVISLCFFVPQQLGLIASSNFASVPGSSLPSGNVHVWLYNFHFIHVTRNSGPFWEPGAFAGYIILALLLSTFTERKVSNVALLVLTISLITTLSTTGLLVLAPTAYLWLTRTFRSTKIDLRIAGVLGGSLILVIVFGIALEKAPFLADKIESQAETVMKRRNHYHKLRFGAAVYDWDFITKRPLIGWTPAEKPREKIDPNFSEIYMDTGNGFTGFAAKFGLIALFFYLYRVYVSSREHGFTRFNAFVAVLIVTALLQGEQFLNFPLFLTMVMLPPRWRCPDGRADVRNKEAVPTEVRLLTKTGLR